MNKKVLRSVMSILMTVFMVSSSINPLVLAETPDPTIVDSGEGDPNTMAGESSNDGAEKSQQEGQPVTNGNNPTGETIQGYGDETPSEGKTDNPDTDQTPSEATPTPVAEGEPQPTETPVTEENEEPEELVSPAFNQYRTIDGITITVTAEENTFPEGSTLSAEKVTLYEEVEKVEAAVEEVRQDNENKNVAVSYTFDIKVLDKDGNEVQPAEGKKVNVSFALAEVNDENLETQVYHISEDENNNNELVAETLEETEESKTDTESITVETEGFSYYTVEFTYNTLEYVLPGDESIALTEILETVGLTGEATDVTVSNAELFSASNETGTWIITAHQAFSTEEWMKVTINGIEYEIKVTDDQETVNATTYQLWVGGTQVTSENAADILGNATASYDADSNTLTLNNVSLPSESGVHNNASIYYEDEYHILTIVLQGTNSISGTKHGIYSSRQSISFNGDGSLDIDVTGRNKRGIYSYFDITINSGTITANVKDDYTCHTFYSPCGKITINGGTVTAISDSYYGKTIYANGGIEINGGVVNAKASGYYNHAFYADASSSFVINKGSVTAESSDGTAVYARSSTIIGKDVTSFIASGKNKAIANTVKNEVEGIGWTTTDGTGESTNIETGEGRSLSDYKKLQFPKQLTYTVTYETNGGSSIEPATNVSALPETLPTTTRENYTFGGWYTDESLTIEAVAGAAITEDTTLYAKWTVEQGDMTIFAKPLEGDTKTLSVKSSFTIATVKDVLRSVDSSYSAFTNEQLRLFYTAYLTTELENDKTLSDYGITSEKTLDIILNKRLKYVYHKGSSNVKIVDNLTNLPNPLPEPPAVSTQTFVNWYTDEGLTQVAVAGAPMETDMTLFAEWIYRPAVARIISDTRTDEYSTLESALKNWISGTTLQLLEDVEITDTIAINGNKNVTLDLNGHSITANCDKTAITVESNNTLSITNTGNSENGKITHADGRKGTGVTNGGTLNLISGNITNNTIDIDKNTAAGVRNNGIFYMTGGTISNNSLNSASDSTGYYSAGGVYNGTNGVFNMSGGSITNNDGNNNSSVAGGVMNYYGKFAMTGGSISQNQVNEAKHVQSVGGLYNCRGRITIEGDSEIKNNSGTGIYTLAGTLTMTGGVISGNESKGSTPGGVGSTSDSVIIMSGGEITGNTSTDGVGGIQIYGGSAITLSGNPVISGNDGINNRDNLELNKRSETTFSLPKINVIGQLGSNAEIYVSLDYEPRVFTSSSDTSYNDATKFFSDDSSYDVVTNSDGQLAFGKLYPLWVGGTQVSDLNASNITGSDPATASYDAENQILTLNGYTYSGEDAEESAIFFDDESALSIVLEGTNTLTNTTGHGIYSFGELSFSGEGKLNISAMSMGIAGTKVSVTGGTVTASSTDGYGIFGATGVSITGGNVEATANSNNGYGVFGFSTSYNLEIGENVTSVVITGGEKATNLSVKNFVVGTGWSDTSGTEGMTNIPVRDTGTSMEYKKIKFPAGTYTVTFDVASHGTAPDAQQVIEGTLATKPDDPSADGYIFQGWFKDAAYTTAWDFASDLVTEDTTIYAKWIEEYHLYICNTLVTELNASDVFGDGKVIFDAKSNKLTLKNAQLNVTESSLLHDNAVIAYSGTKELIIQIEGSQNKITSTVTGSIGIGSTVGPISFKDYVLDRGSLEINAPENAIYSESSITINNGVITATASTTSNNADAIKANHFIMNGGTLTAKGYNAVYAANININGGAVTASGSNYGIFSSGSTTISGQAATYLVASGSKVAIVGTVKNAVPGIGWTNEEGTEGQGSIGVDTAGRKLSSDYKKVEFAGYPLWVGGKQVNVENASDIFGNKTASYDASTNTLTLNGYVYEGQGYYHDYEYYGIYYGVEETDTLNIVIADGTTNSIVTTSTHSMAIYSYGNLTISGNGKLIAQGGSVGNGIVANENITISGTDIEARGYFYGIHAIGATITMDSGSLLATKREGTSTNNIGIGCDYLIIGENVTSIIATGITRAMSLSTYLSLKNSVPGIAWTNFEGTEGAEKIEANYRKKFSDQYKKVVFPAYDVTFDMQGHGEEIQSQYLPANSKIEEPRRPEADGYYFKGWYKEAVCTNAWDFSKDTVTENTTLYAKWIEGHTHNNIAFEAWNESQSLPTEGGKYYYLTTDVTLSDPWNVSVGTIGLCLNGHTITAASGRRAFYIADNGILNLYDCSGEAVGKITGGSTTDDGGGIYINGGTFNMYGGAITGNNASKSGGGLCIDGGTFNMYGGTITSNTAVNNGGGVYLKNGTFNVSGNASITGNTANNVSNNVYLPENKTLTIPAALTDGASIGVTMENVGTFTSGYDAHNSGTAPSAFFTSDNNAYAVTLNNGEAQLESAYTVTFNVNGHGTAPTNQVVASGGKVAKPEDPVAEGYIFGGWYKEDTLSSVWNFDSDTVTDNTTLYAKWIELQEITATADNVNVAYDGTAHGITVNVTSPESGAIIVYGTAEGTYSLNASPTITNVSESPLTVYYKISAEGYKEKTGSATVTINKAEITPTVNPVLPYKYYGDTFETPTVLGNKGNGEVTFEYRTSESEEYSEAVPTNAGAYYVRATIEETDNFKGATAAARFEILQRPLTVTGITAENKVYDGNATASLNYSRVVITGLVSDDDVTVRAKGTFSDKNVDTGKTVTISDITFEGDAASNYVNSANSQNSATANITAKEVGLTWSGTEFTYDENSHVPAATATNLVSGDTCDVTVTGAQINAGTYTATASALSNTNYALPATNTTTFTIAKAIWTKPEEPQLSSVTATTITLVGTAGYEYSKDNGTTWQTSNTFTGLEQTTTYTFYQRIAADANHTASPKSDGKSITTTEHVHQWGNYSVNDNVITAICSAEGHQGSSNAATLTISANSKTYDGNPAEAVVVNNIEGITPSKVTYKEGTTELSGAPIGAGSYTAEVTAGGVTASISFEISKADITPTVTQNNWVYGYSKHSGPSVTGNLGNGDVTFTYKNSNNEELSAAPVDAGTYSVVAAISATANYNSATTAPYVFKITKRPVIVADIKALSKEYDGTTAVTLNYNNASIVGNVDGDGVSVSATGTFSDASVGTGKTVIISNITLSGGKVDNYYLLSDVSQSKTSANITPRTVGLTWGATSFEYDGESHIPAVTATNLVSSDTCTVTVSGEGINVGTYTATAMGLSNDNYKLPKTTTTSFNIYKASLTPDMFTVTVPSDAVYDGNPKSASATIKPEYADIGIGTITPIYFNSRGVQIEGEPVDFGTYRVKLDVKGGVNYEDSIVSDNNSEWQFIIAKATPVLSNEPSDNSYTYTGSDLNLIDTIGTTGGTVMYSLDGVSWGTNVPKAKEIGTYTVHYKVSGGQNYVDLAEKTVTIKIKQTQDKPTGLSATKATDNESTDAEITGVDESMEYSIDNGESYTQVSGSKITGLGAGDVLIRKKETETQLPSESVKVTIQVKEPQSAPQGLRATEASTETAKDAVITGVTDKMEYSTDGTAFTPVQAHTTTIPGLGKGTIYVRYMATPDKAPSPVTAVTIHVYGSKIYSPTSGSNEQRWTKGSNTNLIISIKSDYDDDKTYDLFTGIKMDGLEVEKVDTNYTVSPGSAVITLKPKYLESLSVGKHTMTVTFKDGETNAVFYVLEKKSSSDGSGKEKKTDTVVTCQMAGYPSNYVWNEEAKACQAGYIDAGGNFHPYGAQQSRYNRYIPNTGDSGLDFWTFGMMFGLALAAYASVRLIHEEW